MQKRDHQEEPIIRGETWSDCGDLDDLNLDIVFTWFF
jgi:hypothetical protein